MRHTSTLLIHPGLLFRLSTRRVQCSASAILRKPWAACSQVRSVAGYEHKSNGESAVLSGITGGGRSSGSASVITYKTVAGFHVLRVHGYSLLSEVFRKGESIDSSAFDVGGHSWCLQLYPNGESDDDNDGNDNDSEVDRGDDEGFEGHGGSEGSAGHVGLYLCLNSVRDGERVYARPKFSILDHLRNPGPVSDQGWCPFDKWEKTWGSPEWISREKLEKSEYLKDDSFALRCDVDVGVVTKCPDDKA